MREDVSVVRHLYTSFLPTVRWGRWRLWTSPRSRRQHNTDKTALVTFSWRLQLTLKIVEMSSRTQGMAWNVILLEKAVSNNRVSKTDYDSTSRCVLLSERIPGWIPPSLRTDVWLQVKSRNCFILVSTFTFRSSICIFLERNNLVPNTTHSVGSFILLYWFSSEVTFIYYPANDNIDIILLTLLLYYPLWHAVTLLMSFSFYWIKLSSLKIFIICSFHSCEANWALG